MSAGEKRFTNEMFKISKTVMVLLICLTVLFLAGCNAGVLQKDYDSLVAENERLTTENIKLATENQTLPTESQIEIETVDAKLTGGFVATVRQIIPDYVLDNTAPRIAILTLFQADPFLLHLDDEIIAQIKTGEAYYFKIEEFYIGEITKEEFERGVYDIYSGAYPSLKIKSVRLPEEDEMGLNSPNIVYKEASFDVTVPDRGGYEDIANAWILAWCESFAALPDDDLSRLEDWAIDRLDVQKINKAGLPKAVIFSVELSVKPTYPVGLNAFWMAGNTHGSPDRDDSWGQLSREVELRLESDGQFHMINMGTGGMTGSYSEDNYDWYGNPGIDSQSRIKEGE